MTGNDLLDADQQFFAYASVALSFQDAEDLVRRLMRDHRLQGKELKGKNLTRSTAGRHVIKELISAVRQRVHVVVHHKKYALACKFFEYTFEPVLAQQNSIFYQSGFHLFISNLLYLWALRQDRTAEQLLSDFAMYVRAADATKMPSFLGRKPTMLVTSEDPLSQIETFCFMHRRKIAEEIEALESALGAWSLDLTSTSLFSTLSYWGGKYRQLDVYCDHAKPLERQEIYQAMVGRTERIYQEMGGVKRLLTFNLARMPQLVPSHKYFGVQVADVLASAVRHALQQRQDKEAQQWLRTLLPSISDQSVWFDPSTLDLDTPEAFANAVVLQILVDRSLRGENLFKDMPEMIARARAEVVSGRLQKTLLDALCPSVA
jgi:hypothetical protein